MENAVTVHDKVQGLDRLAQRVLVKVLAQLPQGQLTLRDQQQTWTLGDPNSALKADIQVLDARFYRQVLRHGSIGAGESFIQGHWQSSDLTAVIELFARNIEVLDKLESYFNWLSQPIARLKHRFNANSLSGAKQNILAHYDVGNAMYQQFLDGSMLYSSAIYADPQSSLAQAQQFKLRTICERLQLKQGMTLLEIGTGWGALAIYAAKHYGVEVTTTTISDAQYDYAAEKINQAGLNSQISLLKQDYRLLEGTYDRIVSIEMIEAVGHEFLPEFFAKLNTLLDDGGLMLLQAITIADRRYDNYRKSVDFIQKYIFPGGCLPSVARMSQLLSEQGQMQLLNLWDFGLDYARTLSDWRENFSQHLTAIRKLGYDEQFIRMWLFYFHYCEGGFRARTTSVVHLLSQKQPSFKKIRG